MAGLSGYRRAIGRKHVRSPRRPRWAPPRRLARAACRRLARWAGEAGIVSCMAATPFGQRLTGWVSHAYPRPTLPNASKPRAGQARRARAADRLIGFFDHTRSSENRISSWLRRFAE